MYKFKKNLFANSLYNFYDRKSKQTLPHFGCIYIKMLNYKIKNSEEFILLEDLFEESNIKKSNISYDAENTYFLLNLKIPNPKDDIY